MENYHQIPILCVYFPVNRYELMCVDKIARGETGPDEEKMMVAFQAFDALIPGLGVYTRIFKKLRDDLFGMVTVMILNIRTDRSEQTRVDQSVQSGSLFLPFHRHLLDTFLW